MSINPNQFLESFNILIILSIKLYSIFLIYNQGFYFNVFLGQYKCLIHVLGKFHSLISLIRVYFSTIPSIYKLRLWTDSLYLLSVLFDNIWRIRNQTNFAGHSPETRKDAEGIIKVYQESRPHHLSMVLIGCFSKHKMVFTSHWQHQSLIIISWISPNSCLLLCSCL